MATETQTCYRHDDRRAGVTCQRCERPICPSCMHAASVGFHCPECTRSGRQKVLTARSLATRPVATQVLIAVNVAVFVIGLGGGDVVAGRGGLASEGGLIGRAVDAGDWWRIITSGFLHAGLMHLGFNMMALWILGGMVEKAVGPVRFVAVYLTALLAGSFGVLLADPNALTVGASGAVFGLMGAAVAGQRARGISPWDSGLGTLLVVNLLFTFAIPGISIGGHLGGLVGGAVAGWLLFDLGPRVRSAAAPLAACGLLAAACVIGSLWAASQWASRL